MSMAVAQFTAPGLPIGRVTPTLVAGQAIPIAGMGICDPFLRQILTGPEIGTYSTGYKAYALAAAAGDITRATGVTEITFVAGVGDLPTAGNEGYWFVAPQAYTNNLAVGSGLGWLETTGTVNSMMKVEIMEPLQRAATGAVAATDAEYHNAFLRPGLGYNEQIKSDFANNSSFILNYGITGSNGQNRVGPPAFYGTAIGIRGGSVVQNGNFQDPLFGRPFQGVILYPPRATDNLFTLTNLSGQAVAIANIAAAPTSVSNSAGVALTSGNVFLPYRVTFEGYRVCMDTFLWCAVAQQGVNPPQGVHGGAMVAPGQADYLAQGGFRAR